METIEIRILKDPGVEDPILIEGLPGVGNVGKLAAEHLIDECGGEKFAEIYSKHFPPQVFVNADGVIKLVNNELWAIRRGGKGRDLIVLVGDYQGLTPEGQYELSDRILRLAQAYGTRRVYTLGGYGLGKLVEAPRVLGATTSKALVEEMERYGVVFHSGEPGSGIVGASGLLLGLSALAGIEGVCLMGETSGYFVDPKSAQVVLQVLSRILDLELSYVKLEDKADQIDKLTHQLYEIEEGRAPEIKRGDDLRYIG